MSGYEEKIEFFRSVVDNILKGLNYYISLNIISINEYNSAQELLEKTINLINSINYDDILNDFNIRIYLYTNNHRYLLYFYNDLVSI